MDIFDIFMSVATTASIVIALIELASYKKSRRFETLSKYFEKLSTPEAKDRVSTLYRIIDPRDVYDLTRCDNKIKEIVEEIEPTLNKVGYLVTQGIIDENDIYELYAVRVIRCWHHLRFYVWDKRKNEVGNHARYFEHLAFLCLNWWLKKYDDGSIVFPTMEDIKSMLEEIISRKQSNSATYLVLHSTTPIGKICDTIIDHSTKIPLIGVEIKRKIMKR